MRNFYFIIFIRVVMKNEIADNVNDIFHSQGVLLLLDSPEGLEFGIDNISWKIGIKFKGVKMIPLGVHIIAYSLKSENNMFKISKFILFTKQSRIHVYRWNKQIDQFLEMRGEEAEGYREGVKQYHFDHHLGAYPKQNLSFWSSNTKYLVKEVLAKLDPIDKLQQFNQQYSNRTQIIAEIQNLHIDEDQDAQDDENISDKEEEVEQNNKRDEIGKFKVLSDTIYYSEVPRTLTASPSVITQVNMDKMPILNRIISREWKKNYQHFLGEIQYSFIKFIIGEDQQSLTQWKKLIDLVAFSEGAFLAVQAQNYGFNAQKCMMDFIAVFYDQLRQFPQDFFIDELSKSSFLCSSLKRLSEYQLSQQYSSKGRKRLMKLFEMIKARFNYEISLGYCDQEQNPVFVDLNEGYF